MQKWASDEHYQYKDATLESCRLGFDNDYCAKQKTKQKNQLNAL